MTNKRTTRRTLIASLLVVALCFTMLIGTTFAWFTDSVTSASNVIQAGTLKVDIVDANDVSLAGEVIEFKTADNRDQSEILWEPGCTYVMEDFFIVNKGSLALKYVFEINGVNGNDKLLEALEWTVTVGGTEVDLDTFVGKLYSATDAGMANKSEKIVITAHMKEDAGNEYQGLSINGIGITVYATQLAYENDSFDNQYDADASFPIVSEAVTLPAVDAAVNVTTDSMRVELPAELVGELPAEVEAIQLNHSEPKVDAANNAIVFDSVDLVDQDGNVIDLSELSGKVTVTLPIQAGVFSEGAIVTIYHDGVEVATAPVINNTVTYKAEHFCEVSVKETDSGALVATFEELQAALNNGGYVILANDIVAPGDVILNIAAGTKATLILNGYTLSQTDTVSGASCFIKNQGDLTIADGVITYNYTGAAGDSAYANNTIDNYGNLTLNNVSVLNEIEDAWSDDGSMAYTNFAIDHHNGTLIVNSGVIESTGRSVRIAGYNSGAPVAVFNGGKFVGQVWVQGLKNASTGLTINGGSYQPVGADGSSVYVTATLGTNTVAINDGTFNTKIGAAGIEKIINGGTFVGTAVTNTNSALFADNAEIKTTVATAAELAGALNVGGTIVLVANIDTDAVFTVPAGVTVVLDLNGKNITMSSDTAVSMITNNGNLTIEGYGKIAYTFTGTPSTAVAANTISNRGVLVVNGGEISNTGKGNQIGYAIDNYNGSTLTVNGGKITASGSSYYDAIRLFCGANATTVTVNNGEISSIWAQNPSDNKAREVNGTVVINGGTVSTTYYENYTTVKVLEGVTATVTPYGAGSNNTTSASEGGYTVYSFVH